MTKSINQPWAISESHIARYGKLWADLDFIFEQKISAENFKTDPMNCLIGRLSIANQNIHFYYKDLISYSKELDKCSFNVYAQRLDKNESFQVEIKNRIFNMRKHEIGKLAQTINDALLVSLRSYELGLYL